MVLKFRGSAHSGGDTNLCAIGCDEGMENNLPALWQPKPKSNQEAKPMIASSQDKVAGGQSSVEPYAVVLNDVM